MIANVKTATATVVGRSETILTTSKGMSLYYYTPDMGSKVTRTGKCAEIWPPLVAPTDQRRSIPGISGRFATTTNPTGGSLVTYNGWPLYMYTKDAMPGETSGQGVLGVWFVATPDLAPASGAATPTPSIGYAFTER